MGGALGDEEDARRKPEGERGKGLVTYLGTLHSC